MRRKLTMQALSTRTGLAALIIAFAGGTTAVAQTNDLDDWEWEPDEGYHEQEWYDPSDWFDADDGVDYEYDWGDYDTWYDDDEYGYYDTTYGDYGYYNGYYDQYYDAYYDGYYDGYNDDEYGYDDEAAYGTGPYADGYADGYYDGFYDQEADYDYDPYYYIFAYAETPRDERSDRQRAGDERQRGDRQQQMRGDRQRGQQRTGDRQRDMQRRQDRQHMQGDRRQAGQQTLDHHRKSSKIRGTVQSMRVLQGSDRQDDGPLIARVEMQDGKSAIVNLGPNMSRSRLPFQEGDRVTFSGDKTQKDGRTVLRVHTISSNGETAQLAPRQADRQDLRRHDQRDMQRQHDMQRQRGQRGMQQQRGQHDMQRQRDTQRQRERGAQDRQRVTVQGRLDDVSRVDIDSERYAVVRVTLEDGRTRRFAVDENTVRGFRDLDVELGDRIRVSGPTKTVQGRRVIIADRVSAHGEQLIPR